MKAIIGLGNPGVVYANTRHNAGTIFVEWLCKQKFKPKSTNTTSQYILHTIRDDLVICIPTTFMNESGKAVRALNRKFPSLTNKGIIVVHDDLEHKLANVRVKEGGSAQGHNGVDSIIREIKTNSFKRLQLGIDRPDSRQPDVVAKYVLSNFSKDQLNKFKQSFSKAFDTLKLHQFV